MNNLLNQTKPTIYNKLQLEISNFILETESKEYAACRFEINGRKIIYRNAKITPKKVGQFVTFWKRSESGPIEPFHETDNFDLFVVTLQTENQFGQFVFPKSVLIKKGIISTDQKEGKRAFRVYPKWDLPKSKQAIRSQNWQLEYFFEMPEMLADVASEREVLLELYG